MIKIKKSIILPRRTRAPKIFHVWGYPSQVPNILHPDLTTFSSCEIFTISYCPCTERISVWLVLDFQTRFIWLISTFKLSKPTALVKVPVAPTNRNSNHHHLRSQAKRLHYEVRIVTISIRQNLERSHDSKSLSCKYRLKKHRLLSKNKERNISEIMYEAGFSNLSYVAKCFNLGYRRNISNEKAKVVLHSKNFES